MTTGFTKITCKQSVKAFFFGDTFHRCSKKYCKHTSEGQIRKEVVTKYRKKVYKMSVQETSQSGTLGEGFL